MTFDKAFDLWVSWLPITEDEDEAVYIYEYLTELILEFVFLLFLLPIPFLIQAALIIGGRQWLCSRSIMLNWCPSS